MKLEEFKKLFPHADFSYFKEVDGYVVFYSKKKFQEGDDVSEPAFWDNEKSVSHLNLSTTDFTTYIMASDNFLSIYKRMRNYHSPKKEISIPKKWEPEEWAPKKTFHPPPITLSKNTLSLDFENIRIYVNENEYFVLKDSFPDFDTEK